LLEAVEVGQVAPLRLVVLVVVLVAIKQVQVF
jgi:hypothetical protein